MAKTVATTAAPRCRSSATTIATARVATWRYPHGSCTPQWGCDRRRWPRAGRAGGLRRRRLRDELRGPSHLELSDLSTAGFDTWKDSYREELDSVVAFSGQDAEYFVGLKARALLALTARHVGSPSTLTALDIGCGVGFTDRFLADEFGDVFGVDVTDGVLNTAAAANPTVTYRVYDGRRLPFGDGSIDVAFAINVVHHVPPHRWAEFACEMARVLRPGGMAAIFEHNPRNPLTRLVVSNCAFDDDAVLLGRRRAAGLLRDAGLESCEDRYIAFLPSRSRFVPRIEAALRRVPLGAQYYVSAIRR